MVKTPGINNTADTVQKKISVMDYSISDLGSQNAGSGIVRPNV